MRTRIVDELEDVLGRPVLDRDLEAIIPLLEGAIRGEVTRRRINAIQAKAYSEEGVTKDFLDDVGERHHDSGKGPWWAIYCGEYGLHGSHERGWNVVFAEDGVEVGAEHTDLDMRSAIRRLKKLDRE